MAVKEMIHQHAHKLQEMEDDIALDPTVPLPLLGGEDGGLRGAVKTTTSSFDPLQGHRTHKEASTLEEAGDFLRLVWLGWKHKESIHFTPHLLSMCRKEGALGRG